MSHPKKKGPRLSTNRRSAKVSGESTEPDLPLPDNQSAEIQRLREALADKEWELRNTQRLGETASWRWNPVTDIVTWSEYGYRFFGLDPSLPAPTFREHERLFTPESWRRLAAAVENTVRTGIPYEVEAEVLDPNGIRHSAICRGEAFKDASGNIVQLRGIVQDITFRKRAQQALLTSEEKFAKSFGNLPVAVTLVTVAEGKQIEVNDALLRMTGYEREEVIGRTFRELGYWQDPEDRTRAVNRLLSGEEIRNLECRFCRKNGEVFPGLLSADLIDVQGVPCIVTAALDISDLRRAERSVRDLKSKLTLHFEQTLFGVVEWDREGRVKEWNPAAEKIFGYTREEAIGHSALELIVPEDVAQHVRDAFAALRAQTGGEFSSNDNLTKDGRRISCEWFSTPLVGDDGSVVGIMSLVRDVTAERYAQDNLAASEATMAALFDSTDDSIWTVDAERFGLLTFNRALARHFAERHKIEIRPGMTPEEISPWNSAWWKDAYQKARDSGPYETDYQVQSTGRILRLSFNRLVRDGHCFGISVFRKDVTERRRANEELRKSEERLRLTLEANSEGVWDWDIPSGKAYFSPRYAGLLGYEFEEFPRDYAGWKELVHPDDFERVNREHASHFHENTPFVVEFRMRKKSGDWCWIRSRGTVIERDAAGHPVRMLGTHLDITESRRTAEALRVSETRYRSLVESSHDWVWEVDNDGVYTFAGPQCQQLLGYSPEEMVGKTPFDFMPPQEAGKVAEQFRSVAAERTPFWRLENVNLHKDGHEVILETNGVPIFDSNGNFAGFRGMDRDITERKKAERALRLSETRYRSIVESSNDWLCEVDANGRYTFVGPQCREIVGYEPEELIGKSIFDLMTPEEAQRIGEHLASNISSPQSFRSLENVIRHKDGHAVMVETNGVPILDEGGRLVGYRGMSRDISERKRAEEELTQAYEKFLTVFRSAPGIMGLTGFDDGCFMDLNEAGERALGRTREEVIGKTSVELGLWVDIGEREAAFRELETAGRLHRDNHRFRHKSGEIREGLLSAELIKLNGKMCVISTIVDLTEHREAERSLHESEERFARAFRCSPHPFTLSTVVEDRFVDVNEAFVLTTGYSREEAIGRTTEELGIWEHQPEREKLIQLALSGQEIRNVECRFRKKNGEIFIGLLSAELVGEIQGVPCVVANTIDITEWRRTQEALREVGKRAALYVQQTTVGIVEWDCSGSVREWNPAAERIFGYAREEVLGLRAAELIVPDDLASYAKQTMDDVLNQTGGYTSVNENLTKDGRRIVCDWSNTPLTDDDGKVTGVISFVRDVTAERRAQAELLESEEKFSKAFDSSPIMKTIIRLRDQRYLEVNDAFERHTGYGREEIIGRDVSAIGLWSDCHDLQELLHLLAEGKYRSVERSFRTKTGETRTALLSADIIDVAGERCILSTGDDITERKKAEDAVRASEEKFRSIADNLPGVVYQCYALDTGEWGMSYVHERATEILGLSPEPTETFLERMWACILPEDRQRWDNAIHAMIVSPGVFDCEVRFMKPTREEIHLRGVSRPQRHGDRWVYYGILLDVTDRRRAEAALRESEARLHMATQAGRMYAFEWNAKTDAIVRSSESLEILGLTPETMGLTGHDVLGRMHPLDRDRYMGAIEDLNPDEPSLHETYRFFRNDGSTVWLEDFARAVFDDNKRLLRTIGMTIDITARKQAETALVELSGRLITAQEEERKRIARELHDGVSQELAVVSIHMGQLAQKAAGTATADKLKDIFGKLQHALSDIGHLSHQLHPSMLKHVGLVQALRALCIEMSDAHKLQIEFRHKDEPASVSDEIALSLYRVAQESLRNVVKHSRSKRALVELIGSANDLRLSISDEGVGFNTEKAHAGLGLISMQERLRVVGGSVTITPRMPSGTRVEALVPRAKAIDQPHFSFPQ